MITKTHKKHADLTKPDGGKFHRNEIAIIGAPCGIIQNLSQNLTKLLVDFKVGFIDADHGEKGEKPQFHKSYTDKIGHHQVGFTNEDIDYEFRSLFSDADLVLINGNHFKAGKQIVIINEEKRESLQRKLDRLTDVLCFVLDEGVSEVHDFLKSETYDSIPIYSISGLDQIAIEIKRVVEINTPTINGLVLAGGQSLRMGQDKTLINYHGRPQKEYTADLISPFCAETYYSVREESEENESYPEIADSFSGLGPFGGILSAFRKNPNAAWLVVATDIPMLDSEAIQFIVENRDVSKLATCFHNPETKFPEPLITLWEPRAYPKLLSSLGNGYSCPRKVLINSDINKLEINRPDVLTNVNTPEEMEQIFSAING